MKKHQEKVTGIILAGGKAARLGKDKCLLKIGSKTILDVTIQLLSSLCKEIILVTERIYRCPAHVRIVQDEMPNQGPLGGILSGLRASFTSYNLVVGCDMPFLNRGLLEFLVSQMREGSVVIPESPNGLEPLCAVYSKSCVEPIADEISRGNFKVASFFDKVELVIISQDKVSELDPKFLSFFNINTRYDLNLARKIYAERKNIENT